MFILPVNSIYRISRNIVIELENLIILFIIIILLIFFIIIKFKLLINLNFYLFNYLFIRIFIYIDKFNLIFFLLILVIRIFIFYFRYIYLIDYFYLLIIIIFVLNIIILIIRLNFLFLIFWWDILGLISFLLVIYYNNYLIIKISILVIIFNRLGDIFILIILFYLVNNYNLNFYIIIFNYNLFIFFLIFRLIIKSSQFPLNLWLTKAIIAPLPVSSLVHSSTLVTIGIYFIFRFLVYLDLNILYLILLFRLIYYGINMIIIYDLKKLIALSTINNLNLIIFFLYIYTVSYTHLTLPTIYSV